MEKKMENGEIWWEMMGDDVCGALLRCFVGGYNGWQWLGGSGLKYC
jgi:hypothetical protein